MKVVGRGQVAEAAAAVDAGGLVVVPTARWYMLCGAAGDRAVCDRIFAGKRRPSGKPLLYVTRSTAEAFEKFVMTPDAERLVDAFWPGDLALRLIWRNPEEGSAYPSVGESDALVGHEAGVLGELARLAAVPLAATTANISAAPGAAGPEPAITVGEVAAFVSESGMDVAVVVDGGVCPVARHLTVVDCTGPHAVLARSGVVDDRAVTAALTR